MGPFHMQFQLYNCPVTISKKPWQQTSANFRKMSLKLIISLSLLVSVSSFVYETYNITAVSMMTICGNTIVSNIVKHGGQKQNT